MLTCLYLLTYRTRSDARDRNDLMRFVTAAAAAAHTNNERRPVIELASRVNDLAWIDLTSSQGCCHASTDRLQADVTAGSLLPTMALNECERRDKLTPWFVDIVRRIYTANEECSSWFRVKANLLSFIYKRNEKNPEMLFENVVKVSTTFSRDFVADKNADDVKLPSSLVNVAMLGSICLFCFLSLQLPWGCLLPVLRSLWQLLLLLPLLQTVVLVWDMYRMSSHLTMSRCHGNASSRIPRLFEVPAARRFQVERRRRLVKDRPTSGAGRTTGGLGLVSAALLRRLPAAASTDCLQAAVSSSISHTSKTRTAIQLELRDIKKCRTTHYRRRCNVLSTVFNIKRRHRWRLGRSNVALTTRYRLLWSNHLWPY